ncbi:cytochrome P450 [Gigaspora margarita]|uniref:Cytochrome P450 n=1 Tax=Gigaspora margarita TaxID=4874 RepID=A0A8H4AMC2_GIGMA|nr:cytochrome P450 [Gigaspora margarita]
MIPISNHYTYLEKYSLHVVAFKIALIFTTYIFNFYYKHFTRPNPLPGPLPLPFIGNLHNLADVKLFYEQCYQKYGDICEALIDGRRYIVISRPEYIEKILSPAKYLEKLVYLQGLDEFGVLKRGIAFNEDSKSWSYNKRFFTQALLAPKLMDTIIKSSNQLYEELSEYWQSIGKQKNNNNDNWTLETDFSAWFHAYMNDISSIFITGERTYSIASYYNTQSTIKSKHSDSLIENSDKFIKKIVQLSEDLLFFIYVGPSLRHYIPMFRSKSNSMLKNRDSVFEMLDVMIKKRRKEIEEMPVDTELTTNMLTSSIIANTTKNLINIKTVDDKMLRPMNDDEIRGNLLDAFIGGTDTTANLFCFIVYCLCKNPRVKQKMLSEIDSIFPKTSRFYVTQDDLSKLKYCKAIIKETTRVLPVVIMTPRLITEEYEVAGYKWPVGTQFHLNLIASYKHPDFWSNPEVFNPDRFYDEDDDDKERLGTKNLMMFGGNLRMCPGRKLAMTVLLLLMASTYRNYNIELVNVHEPLKLVMGILVNCKELKVRISPRI